MRHVAIVLLLLAAAAHGQMEKRLRVLYDREAFRKRSPAIGKTITALGLRNLEGKKVTLASLWKKKPLVIIGGAYT